VKRRLAWGLTLPLAFAGSETAHALAYAIVYPQASLRASVMLHTGHSYLAYLPIALALAGAAVAASVVVAAVDAARLRPARRAPAWGFALVAPTTFVLQELLELSLHTGTFGWHAALAPTFLPGLLLQLPFAAAAYVAARLLLRAARRIGGALARPRLAPLVGVAPASDGLAPATRRAALVARPRAPPRFAV
jgi:hypothetical protein